MVDIPKIKLDKSSLIQMWINGHSKELVSYGEVVHCAMCETTIPCGMKLQFEELLKSTNQI